MALEIPITEGDTKPVDFRLLLAGAAVDRSSSTITMELTDADGATFAFTGTGAWISAALGTVRYTPATTDILFSNGRLRLKFKVTTGGEIEHFPNGDPVVLIPRKP